MKVLVTGANGFVGQALCKRLVRENEAFISLVRAGSSDDDSAGFRTVAIGALEAPTFSLTDVLKGIEVVVHLAGFAHEKNSAGSLDKMYKSNVVASRNLIESAIKAGVKRFIYVSSVKAFGEGSVEAVTEAELDRPTTEYGKSKLVAENLLLDASKSSSIDVIIFRPPLIYGPGVKANFLIMLSLVNKFSFLPFGGIKNRRSICYVGNLVDVIYRSILHKNVTSGIYYVSDGPSISTSSLLKNIAASMKKPLYLIPMPWNLIRFVLVFLNRADVAEKVLGTLEISPKKIEMELNWMPPYTTEMGIQETTRWYVGAKE